MLIDQKENQQETEKKIIGCDIDGVLFDCSLKKIRKIIKNIPNFVLEKIKKRINLENLESLSIDEIAELCDIILESPCRERIIDRFYKKKKPNKHMIDLMTELKAKGYPIVLITGFPYEEVVRERLEKYKIQYDKIITRKIGEKVIGYKLREIKEKNIGIFIDDSKWIIEALQSEIPEVKSILYYETNERTSEKIVEEIKEAVVELKGGELLNESKEIKLN